MTNTEFTVTLPSARVRGCAGTGATAASTTELTTSPTTGSWVVATDRRASFGYLASFAGAGLVVKAQKHLAMTRINIDGWPPGPQDRTSG